MNENKVAQELVDIAKLVTAKEETLKDAFKGFKKSYVNYGDVNYEDYGGDQIRYDGQGGFEIVNFNTPDSGFPGFILSSGGIDASDLFEGRVNLNTPIAELEPSKYAKQVARFVGAKWHDGEMDADDVANYVMDVVMGVSGYGGYMDDDQIWQFDDYELDENTFDMPETDEEEELVEEMKESIRKTLKRWGLDI